MDLIVLELTGVHVATHESQKTFSMTLYRGRRSRISGVWEDAGGKKERREWRERWKVGTLMSLKLAILRFVHQIHE